MAKTKGIFMGSTYENTIKKPENTLKNSQLMAHETVYTIRNAMKNT